MKSITKYLSQKPKTVPIQARVSPELAQAAKRAAKSLGVSLNALIKATLVAALEEENFLPKRKGIK